MTRERRASRALPPAVVTISSGAREYVVEIQKIRSRGGHEAREGCFKGASAEMFGSLG